MTAGLISADAAPRATISHVLGVEHGDMSHLIDPFKLGRQLKPFVLLVMFDADAKTFFDSNVVHPHSGIGAVTVFTEGNARFDDPEAGTGTIGYGGVEWMRAGAGVLHGQELSKGSSSRIRGYQLWLALPPETETGPAESQYLQADAIPKVGPARVILGTVDGVRSPIRSPDGVTYLLVTLGAGEHWTYTPPEDHEIAFVAVNRGDLQLPDCVVRRGLAVFEHGTGALHFSAGAEGEAVFVLGSAKPHPHDLKLGGSSIHTSDASLRIGQTRIAELMRDHGRSAATA